MAVTPKVIPRTASTLICESPLSCFSDVVPREGQEEQHDLTPNKPFGSCTLKMASCNLPAHFGIQAHFFAGEVLARFRGVGVERRLTS